uniref:Protein spaetzle n=1 Tax=Aceria tosichella TaxID=561515 RepID=A0A6G1SQJ7_9ACAR
MLFNNNNSINSLLLPTSIVLRGAIFILSLGCLAFIFVQASPIRPTPTTPPKQLSPDCSTLIVTNERRAGGSGRSSSGCNGDSSSRRQAKKLPAAVSRLFREEVDNYPEDEIRQILKQTPGDVKDLYNVLNTQLDPNTNLTERMALYPGSNGGGDDDGHMEREENVCRTVTRHVYPREANLHNSLVYIPNNQDFMQVIQAEICQHPDEECGYLRDNLPYGMLSACVQKYSYKKLLYMDPLDKRMASDLFRYPSCCVCVVRTLPLDLRSNHRGNQSKPSSTTTTNLPLEVYSSSETYSSQPMKFAPNTGASNGLGVQQQDQEQPSDRSHDSDSTTASTLAKRTSKQLKRPNNQTLILSDDKVYSPTTR